MFVLSLVMAQIFESPDGGKTVYSRQPHYTERILIRSDEEGIERTRKWDLWGNILLEAKHNIALKDLIDKVEMVYALTKKEN